MNNDANRVAFEAAYGEHFEEAAGRRISAEDMVSMRDGASYGDRAYLNDLWKGWKLRDAQQPEPAVVLRLHREMAGLRQMLEAETRRANSAVAVSNATQEQLAAINAGGKGEGVASASVQEPGICSQCGYSNDEPCFECTAPAPSASPAALTDKQVKAAQEVFEAWFCEELGLDMESSESESVLRKMLDAALLAGPQPSAKALTDEQRSRLQLTVESLKRSTNRADLVAAAGLASLLAAEQPSEEKRDKGGA